MRLKNLTDNVILALPDDLIWSDEFAWPPTVSTVTYLLEGALLVETSIRQAGRPITLTGQVDMAWVNRGTLKTLYAWASLATGCFELTLTDGRVFTVVFRLHETAIDADPVLGFPARHDTDFYRITLRFMEAPL